MKYPSLIKKGDTIGICAPSTGAPGEVLGRRLDNAIRNIEAIGYQVIETESVRKTLKCVSADAEIRAKEFMELYENPSVSVIMPPWGGEFLMDMLPHLDYEKLKQLPPKWICGYSDVTTLSFVLTACCDIATVHGSNLLNMGYASIHKSDMKAFDVMSNITTRQESFEYYGGYTSWDDFSGEVYKLDQPSCWKSLDHSDKISFAGMMIGGCMDVLCKLLGTKYAPDQTEYNSRYNSLIDRYEKQKERIERLQAEKDERDLKADVLSGFLFEIMELPDMDIAFSEKRFGKTVDHITVFNDGRLVFTFFVGKDITVEI